jgi:hypothetical protein
MLTIAVDEPKLAAQKLKKSADQDIREIVIANKMGMQLKKRTAVKGTRTLTIDVSDLRPDIYVVRIFNGKNYQSLQFIKK